MAAKRGTILTDGRIEGLELLPGEQILVRDGSLVAVRQFMSLASDARLTIVREFRGLDYVSMWWQPGTVISFEPGTWTIVVQVISASGDKSSGKATVEISGDDRTHTHVLTDLESNGQDYPDERRTVYMRLTKQ